MKPKSIRDLKSHLEGLELSAKALQSEIEAGRNVIENQYILAQENQIRLGVRKAIREIEGGGQ